MMSRNRWILWVGLLCTLTAQFILMIYAEADADLLLRQGINLTLVQILYWILVILLVLLNVFKSALQWIAHRKIIVPIVAGITAFVVMWLLNPQQEHRLFNMPFSLWVIIAHAGALCALAVLLITSTEAEEKWHRASLWVISLLTLIVAVLYVGSLGEFMQLDLPDEPWSASNAVNYAHNGQLSPSFIASPYGSPDPLTGNYFRLMGLWVRATGSSFAALRAFPLLVGGITLGVFIYLLWQRKDMSVLQRTCGIASLLALSVFVRTTHNLRMDVGLALCGAVVLLGLVQFFETEQRRWLFMAGIGLLIGMECTPTVVLPLGASIGLVLLWWLFRQPDWRTKWPHVAVYVVGGMVAVVIYLGLRLLPDIPERLANFQAEGRFYSSRAQFSSFSLDRVLNYHIRFSLILSPLELVLVLLAAGWTWRRGTTTERYLLIIFGLAVVGLVIIGGAYSYWTLFAPAAAYMIARLIRSRTFGMLSVFVLLPALMAVPIHDMTAAINMRQNSTRLASLEPMTNEIPSSTVVVGDPLLWFPLQERTTFIGWTGVSWYGRSLRIPDLESLKLLNPHIAICSTEDKCDLARQSELFTEPFEIVINTDHYWMFLRQDWVDTSS